MIVSLSLRVMCDLSVTVRVSSNVIVNVRVIVSVSDCTFECECV